MNARRSRVLHCLEDAHCCLFSLFLFGSVALLVFSFCECLAVGCFFACSCNAPSLPHFFSFSLSLSFSIGAQYLFAMNPLPPPSLSLTLGLVLLSVSFCKSTGMCFLVGGSFCVVGLLLSFPLCQTRFSSVRVPLLLSPPSLCLCLLSVWL